MPAEMMQHDRRTPADVVDQHGRTWHTVLDMTDKKWGACGPIMPKDFSAPWVPPAKYLVIPDGRQRRLHIDYERCESDCTQAMHAWEERLHKTAVEMFNTEAPDAIASRNPTLYREVGPPPMDPRLPKAAKAGNPWLLGVPGYAMPEWAAPLFAVRTPQQLEEEELAYAPADVSDVDHFEDYNEAYDRHATGGTKAPGGARRKRGTPMSEAA